MDTEVVGVPKGSGLGTSSILAAASVKGIFEFLGIQYTEDELYSTALCMEQVMSTGGGWQDQVGGVTDGKMICGAGGGGYLQVILRTGVTKDELQAWL